MVPLFLIIALAADPFLYEKEEAELSVGIHEHELKAHVYRLAGPQFLGRKGDGGERAAEHIAARFAKLKLQPAFGESYFQPIPWFLSTPRADGKAFAGRNIGGFIPGSDPQLANEWIILAAHYDHLGQKDGKTYWGADDNASGVAMLLEVAEAFALADVKPKRSIYFLSFDMEEVGLGGSTHFAAHPPRDLAGMKAFLVADLLGRSMADVMDEYMFVLGSETSPGFATVVDAMPAIPGLTTGKLGADLVGTRSDYGPFRDRKIPFLFFTTGVHRDYHKPTDLPERINYPKLTRNSRYIDIITRKLADIAEPPRWEPAPLGPGIDEVTTVRVLFDRALAKPDFKRLTEAQRQRLEESRDRLAAIAERKTLTAEERTWLINTGRWALATVFCGWLMQATLQALSDGPDLHLEKPVMLLGRHEECDVQLNSTKVSRRHCVIAVVNDRLVIRDLGSTNGVRINGKRHGEADLHHGDELAIGNFKYRVSIGDEPTGRPPRPPQDLGVSSEIPVALPDEDGDNVPTAKKA